MDISFQCKECGTDLDSTVEPMGYSKEIMLNIEPCPHCLEKLAKEKDDEMEDAIEKIEDEMENKISELEYRIEGLENNDDD